MLYSLGLEKQTWEPVIVPRPELSELPSFHRLIPPAQLAWELDQSSVLSTEKVWSEESAKELAKELAWAWVHVFDLMLAWELDQSSVLLTEKVWNEESVVMLR